LPATEPGLSSIESVLSLGLELVARGELSRVRLLQALTTGPSAILQESGLLKEGAVADLCVFDPEQSWQPSAQTLMSMGNHAPVLDRPLRGRVKYTLVQGREVWTDNPASSD